MTMDAAISQTTVTGAAANTRDIRLAVAILGIWLISAVVLMWNNWPEDLSAVYVAGHMWRTGQPELVYAAPEHFFGGPAQSWLATIAELGGPEAVTFPYVYPPLWAVLVAPLTKLSSALDFANTVSVIHFSMLGASVLLAARLFRPANMPLWVWAMIGVIILTLSIQSHYTLGLNQPTISVTFLILLSFERLQAGRPGSAGLALAIAAAIKLSPALFAVVFLIDRQYRAFVAFTIFGAALGLLSLALAGIEMHLEFLSSLSLVSDNALLSIANVSLKPMFLSIAKALGFGAPMDLSGTLLILKDVPGWLGPVLALVGLAYCVPVLRALHRRERKEARTLMLLVLSIIIPLTGPLGWQHYYLLPMLLLPGFVCLLPSATARFTAIVMGAGSLTSTTLIIPYLSEPLLIYVWFQCAIWLFLLAVIAGFALKAPKHV